MTFLWPEMLWLLLVLPVVVGVYWLVLRRKKKAALHYASLNLLKEAMTSGQRFRRHVPPLLFLCALALMIAAVARPAAVVTLPSQHETVILAMDVSGSMKATDVKPSRIVAAQEAARAFIADQPMTTRIGVVSFAATASVVQSPTHSREDLLSAIDRFQLQRGTAVGSGILVALKMIFPDADFDLRSSNPRREAAKAAPLDATRPADKDKEKAAPQPVAPGSYTSAAIILLTDGQTTTGPDPIEAARMAADRGVRIYTVGVGTQSGEVIGGEGWSFHVRLDEESLKTIANLTRGEYFYAGTATDLVIKIFTRVSTPSCSSRRRRRRSPRSSPARRRRWLCCRRCCRSSGSIGSCRKSPRFQGADQSTKRAPSSSRGAARRPIVGSRLSPASRRSFLAAVASDARGTSIASPTAATTIVLPATERASATARPSNASRIGSNATGLPRVRDRRLVTKTPCVPNRARALQ